MNEPDKKARYKLMQSLAQNLSGSDINNGKWEFSRSVSGIRMRNFYRCEDTHSSNMYADFSIFLSWREPLVELRLYFHGAHSQHKARFLNLRDYLEDILHHLRAIADQYAGEERSKEFIKNLAFEIATYQERRHEHRD